MWFIFIQLRKKLLMEISGVLETRGFCNTNYYKLWLINKVASKSLNGHSKNKDQ